VTRNIDLTKPLGEMNEDDLRYAHDRSLLSPEDTERVGQWLRKVDAERALEGPAAAAAKAAPPPVSGDPDVTLYPQGEGDGDTETVEFNPSDYTVDEVNEYLAGLEDDGPGTEEAERVLAAERADKNRKGIVGED
jgi:hypothetical protein